MNITHAVHEVFEGDPLDAIFNRQRELMTKYHDIELKSGLMQTEDCPIDLDDKKGQARIKDFAWRVTEELGEALDAYEDMDHDHYVEELIDGLHFLTELTILAGLEENSLLNDAILGINVDKIQYLLDKNKVYMDDSDPGKLISGFVKNMGMTCNCLKNKPWKQTPMLTDKTMFYTNLRKAWASYFSILASVFKTSEELSDVYFRKSQVNKFRQRSMY